jgi:hypothetical protein
MPRGYHRFVRLLPRPGCGLPEFPYDSQLSSTLMSRVRILSAALLVCLAAHAAQAAQCVNRFVSRAEGNKQVVTLLTGKLTFQEAQALAKAIQGGSAPPLEWVSESGKALYKQVGELKVVRPMPVGCDGKSSGTVMIVTFMTQLKPSKKIHVKIDANTIVAFDEQAD